MLVFESKYFQILAPRNPHVSRTDGGHLIIAPKEAVEDRTKLSSQKAIELMKLTMVAGEAMRAVLLKSGVDIRRINYQENGNWKNELHVHLYGRAKSATFQKYGAPLKFPATQKEFDAAPTLEPIKADEITAIGQEITRLLAIDKYSGF